MFLGHNATEQLSPNASQAPLCPHSIPLNALGGRWSRDCLESLAGVMVIFSLGLISQLRTIINGHFRNRFIGGTYQINRLRAKFQGISQQNMGLYGIVLPF